MQFTALLAAFSLTFAMGTVSKYVTSTLPHAALAMHVYTEEEFLIAATMAIAGLFSVLAWTRFCHPARLPGAGSVAGARPHDFRRQGSRHGDRAGHLRDGH